MLILGCIREISVTEIIVNLPNSLNGYIPITSINQSITDELGKDEEGNELEKVSSTWPVHRAFARIHYQF